MNKEDFLKELAAGLSSLSEQERKQVLDYYKELICDGIENGKSEESATQECGSPKEIAAQICSEYHSTSPVQRISPEQQDYRAKEPVRSIILDAVNVSVQIHEVPDGPVRVQFVPLESDHVICKEENGVFIFTHTMSHILFHWRDMFHYPRNIMLEIPVDFRGDVSVTTNNARINADSLHGIHAGNFTTSNGHITISNVKCHSLQVKTSNGAIDLLADGGDTCTAKTSNGHIHTEDCRFPAQFQLHTNNASIHSEHSISDNIIFKTGNSSINATVNGDMREYAIYSHTSNSHSNLPTDWSYPGQTKRLSAETSNAHIDVKFLSSGV